MPRISLGIVLGAVLLSHQSMLVWDTVPYAESYLVYVNSQVVREVRDRQTPVNGLPPGKCYVTAVNRAGESPPSNTVEIPAQRQTGRATLRVPRAVTVKPVTIGETR